MSTNKKNTARIVLIICLIIGLMLQIAVWDNCTRQNGIRPASDGPFNKSITFFSLDLSDIQAEPEMSRLVRFAARGISGSGDSIRKENRKILALIVCSFSAESRLPQSITDRNLHRTHCHGNASIIRYIHHTDGQK